MASASASSNASRRSFEEDIKFIKGAGKFEYRIETGFVPRMNVSPRKGRIRVD
jgi:hypothetical protein